MNDGYQDEIERLKREVERLQKALEDRQQLDRYIPPSPKSPPSPIDNLELISDCARFAEGLVSEQAVRKKYRFDEATWERLGQDNALVEAVELEKTRRIRSGEAKREKAQHLIVKGPEILDSIMSDVKVSPKHKVDAIKTLDALAANGPRAEQETDRVVITINLGGDEKLVFDKPVRPIPSNDTTIIDATPQELPPPRRGPGRPPGSRNKPQLDQQQPLPGFITDADHL